MISKITTTRRIKELLHFLNLEKIAFTPLVQECDITSFQHVFNVKLAAHLDEKVASYRDISGSALGTEAVEYAASLVREGGKRVRPYMAFLAYETEGGTNQEEVLQAGIALELFHTFALIHDDIIDKGLERHSKDTTHVHIEKYIAQHSRGDKKHIAEAVALLAGDLMFSWSHEAIAQLQNKKIQSIFFKMIEEVVAGQMLDVSFMLQYDVELRDIFQKNVYKTALYSFVNPMLIGATLAGATQNENLYRTLGLCLGQAFQIQDDLLDIVGDPAKTGKKRLLDVQDGQHTILTQYIFEHATENDRNIFRSLFGKEINEYSVQVLLKLFKDTGAIAYAEQEIQTQLEAARACISQFHCKRAHQQAWGAFIELLNKRKS